MTKRIAIAAMVVGLGLTTACASATASQEAAPATSERSCFFADQINGWRSEEGDKVIYLEVGVNDMYRADLFSRCTGVDDALTIGVKTRGGGSSVCDGMDLDLIIGSPIGPQTCHVTKLTKLTPAEIQALKAAKK
ncbi:MAG TPA: DUF6491 family protein [Caulobacter sp.]|mgnify:CR=1 FL=1|nr:DUF6491 family protein [Caulobacter sp.]